MELNRERLKLAVSIVKRGAGHKIAEFYKRNKLHYNFICLGAGTANSEILDYLGLETNEKDVVLTLVPAARIPGLTADIKKEFKLDMPGRGIVFTVPLASVSARAQRLLSRDIEKVKETYMESEKKYELILIVLNRGYADVAMQAAKSAGARGATILHARRVGFEEVESLFGFAIEPEKEIIAILADTNVRRAVTDSVTEAAGIDTEAKALVLSLPVDEICGI